MDSRLVAIDRQGMLLQTFPVKWTINSELARTGAIPLFIEKQTLRWPQMVLKPPKSYRSVFRQSKRAKIHTSRTKSRKRSIAGKNWSYRSSWRDSYALKFEDGSQEETKRQKRCARREEMLVQSIWKRNADWDAIFSGVSQNLFERGCAADPGAQRTS